MNRTYYLVVTDVAGNRVESHFQGFLDHMLATAGKRDLEMFRQPVEFYAQRLGQFFPLCLVQVSCGDDTAEAIPDEMQAEPTVTL